MLSEMHFTIREDGSEWAIVGPSGDVICREAERYDAKLAAANMEIGYLQGALRAAPNAAAIRAAREALAGLLTTDTYWIDDCIERANDGEDDASLLWTAIKKARAALEGLGGSDAK